MEISEPLARKRVQHLREHLRCVLSEESGRGNRRRDLSQAVQ
jgi:RNA polymerase sigma-70 factor (ECF subfamily)